MALRLQSAIEYLTTYGWALLILIVAISALFAIGIFNPSGIVNQQCILQAGFSCVNFYMYENGILVMNILQSTQSPINVTGIGCYQNTTKIQLQTLTPQAYMPIGTNATFNVQCYSSSGKFSGKINAFYQGSIAINYTDVVTGFPQIGYGTIIARITR